MIVSHFWHSYWCILKVTHSSPKDWIAKSQRFCVEKGMLIEAKNLPKNKQPFKIWKSSKLFLSQCSYFPSFSLLLQITSASDFTCSFSPLDLKSLSNLVRKWKRTNKKVFRMAAAIKGLLSEAIIPDNSMQTQMS